MNPTRRDFLKITTVGGAAAAVFGFDLKPAFAQLRTLKIARANETRSTCPYCSVSCGVIIYTIGDRAKKTVGTTMKVFCFERSLAWAERASSRLRPSLIAAIIFF